MKPVHAAFDFKDGTMLSYYELERTAGSVADYFNRFNGTVTGADRGIAGINRNAYNFSNPDNDVVNITDLDGELNQSFSINLWANLSYAAASDDLRFFGIRGSNGGTKDLTAFLEDGNSSKVCFRFYDQGDGGFARTWGPSLVAGEFAMLTFTFDDNTDEAKLYVNGTLYDTKTTKDLEFADPVNFYIGSDHTGADNSFAGVIDEFMIWNKTLTAGDISSLWNSGAGDFVDVQKNETILTLHAPTNATYSFVEQNVSFNVWDGANATINVTIWADGSIIYFNESVLNDTTHSFFHNFSHGLRKILINANSSTDEQILRYFTIDAYNVTTGTKGINLTEGVTAWYAYNISIFDSKYTFKNISFYWNSTEYSGSTTTIGNWTNSSATVTLPTYINRSFYNESASYYWTYCLELWNGSHFYYNSSSGTQNIYNIILSNESIAGTSTAFINLTVKDEADKSVLVNNTIDIVFETYVGSTETGNYSFGFVNNSYMAVNLYPTWANQSFDADCIYNSVNYSQREYYWDDATLDNTTNAVSLYLTKKSIDEEQQFIVYDTSNIEVEGAFIRLERWYQATNSYAFVSMMQTDSNGEAQTYIDPDAFYRLSVLYEGEIKLTESPTQFITSPYEIFINLGAELSYISLVDDVTYTISYVGGVVTVSVTDSSGSSTSGTLDVRTGAIGDSVCSSSGSGASYTLICDVSTESSDMMGYITIIYDGSEYLLTTMVLESVYSPPVEWGDDAVFLSWLVVGVLGIFGATISLTAGVFFPITAVFLLQTAGFLVVRDIYLYSLVFVGILIILVVEGLIKK